MKNTPSSLAASPISQEALDSLLITAAGNPRGEAQDENGLTQTVAELLARGADVNAANSDGVTALMIAAKNGHTQTVAELLNQGANVDAVTSFDDDMALTIAALRLNGLEVDGLKSNGGGTALMLAAQNGHTAIVLDLLSRDGINVNAAKNDGTTALKIAARNGHAQIVAELLDRGGADVNAVTSDGETALMIAAQGGHTETVAELLNRGANVDAAASNGETALASAAWNGHIETVSALLYCERVNVNAALCDGATALTLAAYNGHTEIVSALLSCDGINVNAARTSDGFTALMIAAQRGHTETVLALLSRDGADWQIVQDQLNHPALRDLDLEVSVLLAVALPEGELRNSIITSFNQRNPNNQINQENNDILGAGIEDYKNLKDLKSWHIRYLTDSGCPKNEVRNLANRRFFDLLNHQDARQEALARNDLVADLVSKSTSLAFDFVGLTGNQEHLEVVSRISPEDFYKLTTKIIDGGNDGSGIPRLEALSLVAALRKDRKDQTSASPAPTMYHGSVEPIVTPQKGGHFVIS